MTVFCTENFQQLLNSSLAKWTWLWEKLLSGDNILVLRRSYKPMCAGRCFTPAAPHLLIQRCQKQGFKAGKICYQSSKQVGHATSKAMSICPLKTHWQGFPNQRASPAYIFSAPSRLLWGGGSWAHAASCASPAHLVTGPPWWEARCALTWNPPVLNQENTASSQVLSEFFASLH